jgi:exodeoxyribonuclease VII small subunit
LRAADKRKVEGRMNDKNTGDVSVAVTGTADSQEHTDDQDITMEEAFSRLNKILDEIEGGALPLEKVFKLYQEGLKLIAICEGKIDRIEKQLKIVAEAQ